MRAEAHRNNETGTYDIIISIPEADIAAGGNIDLTAALNAAVVAVAKKYVQDNSAAIMRAMNPQAIANLAIAESAQLIRQRHIDPKPIKAKKEQK